VVVESFGNTRGVTFFGMPPVQSVLIPFALPALTLYGVERQKGYARVHIDFFEYQSGKIVGVISNHDRTDLLHAIRHAILLHLANHGPERSSLTG
jgi:hypothetical protein